MTSMVRKSIIIITAVFVLLGTVVVGVLLGSAAYGWKAAQRAGNEAATQQNLKTIAAVEMQYYNTHSRIFGTLDQLIKEAMLTSKFSGKSPMVDGYVFSVSVTPKTVSQPSSYTLNADPLSANTGKRHFYIDSESPTIHVHPDRTAGPGDPALAK